ncbi:AAA domain-containing protein, putative AbiEii toxin, Type IV TA system [Bacillus sp. OV194]|nr:AAA domain-containing protein, putative AbiEii toxin, Type IV TA system [Bacillus sp. OV194]
MNLQERIWEWSSNLPGWQCDLIRRLYAKSDLNDNELAQVLDNLLFEFGVTAIEAKIHPLEKIHIPNKQSNNSVKIKALNNFQNIAAIEPQYGIEFSTDGLSIIYGDNSAGKSSYAKVLKQACRAVDNRTKVHPNIYKLNEIASTADIHLKMQSGDTVVIHRTVNTAPEQYLSSISIFDTECAKIYAESENEVVFIPEELKIFDQLAVYQTRLKQQLIKKKETFEQTFPTFPEFIEETNIKLFIQSLSFKTKEKDIVYQCTFNKEDQLRQIQIEKDLKILLTDDPKKILMELERNRSDVSSLMQNLHKIASELTIEKIHQFIDTHHRYLDAKDTLNFLTTKTFEEQPLIGVGSNPWRNLWEAARTFQQTAYPGYSFPHVEKGSRCLLCQQDIEEEGKQRLVQFEEFIKDTISQDTSRLDLSRRAYLSLLKSLPTDNVERSSIQTYLMNEDPVIGLNISQFITSASKLITYLQKAETDNVLSITNMPEIVPLSFKNLEDWLSTKTLEINELKQLVESDNTKELQKEQKELLAKQIASKRLDDIMLFVFNLKKNEKLNKAIKALDTTKLTKKYNEFSSIYLSDDFNNVIAKELRQLRCDNIKFKLNNRGVKGKTTVKLGLNSEQTVQINEILSEGEQKAFSLAFFLAEISALPDNGGIILDDPVSSLDHGRREYVAKRLVEESKTRQVIIFTHDIVFLHTLQKHSKLQGIEYSCSTVRRIGRKAGIIKPEFPWITQKTKQRIGYLKNQLPRLKKNEIEIDPDEYSAQVKDWYRHLRETWERAVEELMFNGVIERFEPNVKTQSLSKAKISDDLVKRVTEAMTKTSMFVHDEPSAGGRFIPTNDEMKDDIAELELFSKQFK